MFLSLFIYFFAKCDVSEIKHNKTKKQKKSTCDQAETFLKWKIYQNTKHVVVNEEKESRFFLGLLL